MKFNQKTKGVISIFLLITFSTVFIFSGILVDGGRMHMAKALATSSLDNAASSALSYYDELLLDLYGLFAMAEVPAGTDSGDDESSDDDALVEAINKRMEKYFRQTLGLITTDEKQTDAMVKKLMESFDGYDFQVDSFSSGTNLNLGQTEVLKTQIVEHMKYRAPLQLVNVEYGFLDGLQEIFDMKEILKSTKDKNDIVKRYKSAVFEGNTVVNLIIDFLRSSCTTYVAHPVQGVTLESYFNDIVIERLQQLYTDYETICQQEEDSTKH